MVIEWLRFRVPPHRQAAFLAADAAIWTPALATSPGFLGKEAWVEAEDPAALSLLIRWSSKAHWAAMPPALLAETDARFATALGEVFPVLSCTEMTVAGAWGARSAHGAELKRDLA